MQDQRGARHISLGPADIAALRKRPSQHKYDHGHAVVFSGGAGRTGAARLAAMAALRIGAGLVTLAVPGAAQLEVAAQVTSIMLRRFDGTGGLEWISADPRINAICIGPGFGMSERHADILAQVMDLGRPMVLDADAISLLAGPLSGVALPEGAVLTPHWGEFTRLFPDFSSASEGEDRLAAVRAASEQIGAIVLLKGEKTLIAAPGGEVWELDASGARAAPWLATAGSGDVLAGLITGLLARGFDPIQAARIGAWIHLACGREAGPGLIAEDLPGQVRVILQKLAM